MTEAVEDYPGILASYGPGSAAAKSGMSDRPIRVLLIEDDPEEADLLRKILSEERSHLYDVQCADRLSTRLDRLAKGGVDIVLLDLVPPDSAGLETLREVHARAPEVPIVVLAGRDDETLAVKAVQAGAQDCLVKHQLDAALLGRSIRCALGRHQKLAQRNREARELRAAVGRLRGILEKNSDAIVVVDLQGITRFLNPAAEILLGRTASELLGQPFGFPVVAGATNEIEIVGRGEEKTIAEMRVVETEWEGKSAYLASLRDITERKRLEEMKSRLVSSINHDLRTPLTAVKGYTDLLLDGAYGSLSEEQGEAIQAIGTATQRMIEMVNALLDLRKLESGRYMLAIEPLDLRQLVNEICEEMKPLAQAKGLILSNKVSRGSLPMMSDRRSLGRILSNLVGNAIKFTDRGSVRVSVNSTATGLGAPGKMVEIRVKDTGRGIEAHHLGNIFDAFYQVDQFGSHAAHGTGLGLAICKRLVELLNGKITVKSKVGKGTAFTAVLPQHTDPTTDLSGPRE